MHAAKTAPVTDRHIMSVLLVKRRKDQRCVAEILVGWKKTGLLRCGPPHFGGRSPPCGVFATNTNQRL